MARYATLTGLVIATLSASAAAQTLPSSGEPADPVQQTCAPGIQPRNAVTASTADTPKALLAFLQVRVACPTQPTATSIDGYTRLTVVFQPSDPPNGSERDYKDGQNLLVRYLRGRSISRVLSVKADVLDTKLQGTVPLIAVSHASNKTEGETWSTAMTSRQWLTPYFRINPATGVALEVSLAASTSYQS